MLFSAPLSCVRGVEDSLGEQYMSGMCNETSFCTGAGLHVLRKGNRGGRERVLSQM